jgi:hypothetical protein
MYEILGIMSSLKEVNDSMFMLKPVSSKEIICTEVVRVIFIVSRHESHVLVMRDASEEIRDYV